MLLQDISVSVICLHDMFFFVASFVSDLFLVVLDEYHSVYIDLV